jgi:hypothetical protein
MPNREKSYLAYRIVKQNRLAINFVLLRSISCEAIADHAGTNTPTGPPTYRSTDLPVHRPTGSATYRFSDRMQRVARIQQPYTCNYLQDQLVLSSIGGRSLLDAVTSWTKPDFPSIEYFPLRRSGPPSKRPCMRCDSVGFTEGSGHVTVTS